jgi:uncharacterized protein involved in outer membrane biogenesis
VSRLGASFLAVAALLGVTLLGLWQVPQWLDWTRYRGAIETLASASLGQAVSIDGPVSLTLLPQAVLTASQVSVGGGTGKPSMHVEALRLRIALWSLLAGRLDARELVLHHPDLRIPWPSLGGMSRPRPPPWLAAFSARIESGRVSIGQLVFTDIDAELSALDTGALSAAGSARFAGQNWHFTGRLTAIGADGAAGLNVTLDGVGNANGLSASFSGQLALDGTLAGTLTGRGPNLGILLPAPAVPFRADGRLAIGNNVAALDGLALEIDGSPATGALTLRVAPSQHLNMTIAASRLDFDAWLSILLQSSGTIAGIEMPIAMKISAEAAPLAGGMLEHVDAALDLAEKTFTVRQASAQLPGNAVLRLNGRLERVDPAQPRFEGDMRLEAPVLRTTLDWLDHAMPPKFPRLLPLLPDRVAQRTTMSAHVVAGASELALQRLSGRLDDIPLSGSMAFKRGGPPVVLLDLSMDRLALDEWMPAHLFNLDLGQRLDADLRLGIRQASLGGTAIEGLNIDLAVAAGNILLRRLEASARGAHLAVSGMLGADGRLSDGKLALATGDAGGFAELLPAPWRTAPAFWSGPAKLDMRLTGPPEAIRGDVALAIADGRLEASATIDLRSREWSGALALRHPDARTLIASLGIPEAVGLPGLPGWLGVGSLSLAAHLSGSPRKLMTEHIDLTAAGLHAKGDLTFDLQEAEPGVSGRLDFDTVPLPTRMGSEMPLPLSLLDGWHANIRLGLSRLVAGTATVLSDLSARLSVANDKLALEDVAANLASGTMSGGRLSLDAAVAPPLLALRVRLGNVMIGRPLGEAPIDLLSGRADGSMEITASGYSPSAMLATVGGHATLSVRDGVLSGFDLFRLKQAIENQDPTSAEAEAEAALRSGASGFERLDINAKIAHGVADLGGSAMAAAAGEARASGSVDLSGRTLDVRIDLRPALPNPPAVAVRLTGAIDLPNRVPELADLMRWMAMVH